MPGASPNKHTALRHDSRFDLGRAAVVAPLIERTSTHEPSTTNISATLRFDGRAVDDTPEYLTAYQSGERLARFDAESITNADDMELWLDIPMLCRSVSFDEERATEITWPKAAWPAICASALQPQLAIDPNNEDIFAFTERALGPKPYAEPPVIIAKKLASAVIEKFQPSGIGFEYDRTGRFAGIELALESETATQLTGSPADMAALYCATLRAAGLPARPVIGYNLYSAPEARDEEIHDLSSHCGVRFNEGDSTSLPRLSFWVEFALYDETNNTLEWIPVDVFAQRRTSSRPPALDQPLDLLRHQPLRRNPPPHLPPLLPPNNRRRNGCPAPLGLDRRAGSPPPEPITTNLGQRNARHDARLVARAPPREQDREVARLNGTVHVEVRAPSTTPTRKKDREIRRINSSVVVQVTRARTADEMNRIGKVQPPDVLAPGVAVEPPIIKVIPRRISTKPRR